MDNETKRLEGHVAAILNARELVINIGRVHGVHSGMKFAVLAESPLEVHDPVFGELLDVIDREKVRVEASEVRDRIAICRTYRVTQIPGGALAKQLLGLGAIGEQLRTPREVKETLAIEDASMPPPLSEEESYVKVKDRVIQAIDE